MERNAFHVPFPSSFTEEDADFPISIFGIYISIMTIQLAAVLDWPLFFQSFDDAGCVQVAKSGLTSGLAHFHHAYQMAFQMPWTDEVQQILTSKPTVNQQIIKSYAFPYGFSDHFNGTVNLALPVFLYTGVDCGIPVTFLVEACFPLLVGQPLLLLRVLAFLAMKREVK